MKFHHLLIGKPERFKISVKCRYSVIPRFFLNKTVRIYKGKRWKIKEIYSWIVGFKFGEFCKTRKKIKFKSKASKKKQKKAKGKKKVFTLENDPRIQRIRLIKSGDLRKKIQKKKKINKGLKKIVF